MEGLIETAATITGPNDASGVVWAISKSFSFVFRVFSILTIVFRYHCCFRGSPRDRGEDGWAMMNVIILLNTFLYHT